MKAILLILSTACLFSSCATIFNDKHKIVGIFTNKPASIIYQNDTFLTDKKNRLLLPVLRSKQPLNLVFFDDSLSKKVTVPYITSPTFYWNIYNGIQPVGFFIDWKNSKRYTYSDRIYVNLRDTINAFESVNYAKKAVFLNLSFPLYNNLRMAYEREDKNVTFGLMGLSAGLEYCYKFKKSLSFSMVVIPNSGYGFDGLDFQTKRVSATNYMSVTHNHFFKRWSLGYGISYGKNYIKERNFEREIPYSEKSYIVWGLETNAYYRVGNVFQIGLKYRPTFYRFDAENPIEYEHLISFDLRFKLPLNEVKF
jgi:hypothetical protein